MTPPSLLALAALCLALTACGAEDSVSTGQSSWECPVVLGPRAASAAAPPCVALDEDGALVLFDSKTGRVHARVRPPHSAPESVVFDPFAERVLTIEPSAAGEALVVAHGTDALRFSYRATIAGLSAGAALLPLGTGVAVFEPAGWWMIDGREQPAFAAPFPLSAFARSESAFAALVSRHDRRALLIAETSHEPELHAWLDLAPDARLAAAEGAEGFVAAHVADGRLIAERLDGRGRSMGEIDLGPAHPATLAEILPLDTAERSERLALLLADPARLIVVDLAPEPRRALLPLAGRVEARGLHSSALVFLPPRRLLAATSAGVHAITITADIGLSLDPDFDGRALRPPMAGPLTSRR